MTPTGLALRLLDDHARAQLDATPGQRVDVFLRFAAVHDGVSETIAYSRIPDAGALEHVQPRVRAELAEALHAAGDALLGRDRDVISLRALEDLIATRELAASSGPILRDAFAELRRAVRHAIDPRSRTR